jgi:hypothetical protein
MVFSTCITLNELRENRVTLPGQATCEALTHRYGTEDSRVPKCGIPDTMMTIRGLIRILRELSH